MAGGLTTGKNLRRGTISARWWRRPLPGAGECALRKCYWALRTSVATSTGGLGMIVVGAGGRLDEVNDAF